MIREYSQDIVDAIVSYLNDEEWRYQFDEARGIFIAGVNIKSRLNNIKYLVTVCDTSFTVYAISPVNVGIDDQHIVDEVLRFIAEANYGRRNGNFEIDIRDGEIRYKSFVDCDGITPSMAIIRNSFLVPAMMFQVYGDGILEVIFGVSSSSDALKKCKTGAISSDSSDEEIREILRSHGIKEEDMDLALALLAGKKASQEDD